jgi:imidazolonepropionase-like amidohydrolase
MHADGVKVELERGMVFPVWKVLSEDLLNEIRRGADARHLPIYVHAMNDEMYRQGLRRAPRAFVHRPETISDSTLQALVASRSFVVSTAAVFDIERLLFDQSLLDTPLAALTIPPIERATLHDPEAQHRFLVSLIDVLAPLVPGRFRDLFAAISLTSFGRKTALAYLAKNQATTGRTLLRMHRAGVPIVLGSDAGNWPLFPYYFHGLTTWREIAALERAGFTPAEIVQATTRQAARMLGADNELGSIEIGKRADLLLFDSDPLSGFSKALPTLHTVILDGIAHTPQEWMQLPQKE